MKITKKSSTGNNFALAVAKWLITSANEYFFHFNFGIEEKITLAGTS